MDYRAEMPTNWTGSETNFPQVLSEIHKEISGSISDERQWTTCTEGILIKTDGETLEKVETVRLT